MNLGIILSPGDSLTKQALTGQLDRLVRYYLQAYSKKFSRIYIFSYGDAAKKFTLPRNVILVPKPFFIPAYCYQLLWPLIHFKIIQTIDFFRVFQASGGLPAVVIRLLFHKPYVVTYGYNYVQFAKIEHQPILAEALKFTLPLVMSFAHKIIVTQSELGLTYPVTLIPNGVDPLVFRPERKRLRQFLVLSVGRLVRQKNHFFLLKTISLSRFKSKINFIIIGAGPLHKKLQSLAVKLQINLTIIPNVSHNKLVFWYQKAHVFALTSRIEGQSKALLEAMSSGCACLTTPFSGNIIQDNFCGLIGANPKQLALKLDQLLSDSKLNQRLGSVARQVIIKDFNLSQLVAQEIKLYVK